MSPLSPDEDIDTNPPSAGRLEGVRILIVDDDRDILESFDMALQAEGAETLCVQDGNEAVSVCFEDPPDLVVLDMMLPKRSGFLVLEKIKGHEDSPLVIMVTANEGKRHQAYAENLGVDTYLVKPVPMELLIDTAVKLLDKQEAEDEAAGLLEDDGEAPDSPTSQPTAPPKAPTSPPGPAGGRGKPR